MLWLIIPFGLFVLAFLIWKLYQHRVLSRDDRLLISERLGLIGCPDRIIEIDGVPIPIEKKSAKKVYDSHAIQIVVYMLLIEDIFGVRPPYGIIVRGDDEEIKILNTEKLRRWATAEAGKLWLQRQTPDEPAPGAPHHALCDACGYRFGCQQRKHPNS